MADTMRALVSRLGLLKSQVRVDHAGSGGHADSDSAGLGWGLKSYISNTLPGVAHAAGP